jgi:uncharacterized membrane protein YeaQ/YmgE (transglycosylase-associated protein family)
MQALLDWSLNTSQTRGLSKSDGTAWRARYAIPSSKLPVMLILGLILFGILIGAGAQLILGKSAKGIDWTLAFVAGLAGSFLGGLLISLLSGDGLRLRPSGIIGSLVGALLVTAGWQWYRRRSKASHA